jgi:hypothetical protein
MTRQDQIAFELLEAFVEHKKSKLAPGLKAIKLFIDKNSPILEDVYQRIKKIDRMPHGKVTRKIMESCLRKDLDEANKSLVLYNLLNNILKNRIVVLTSNYTAAKYLQDEYGLPTEKISFAGPDIELIWANSGGKLFELLRTSSIKIEQMRDLLYQQINDITLLEGNQTYYLEGLQKYDHVNDLFMKERQLFEELEKEFYLSKEDMAEVKALFLLHLNNLYQALTAYVNIMRSGINKDWQRRETNVQKLCFIFGFVIQMASLYVQFQLTVGSGGLFLLPRGFKFIRKSSQDVLYDLERKCRAGVVALKENNVKDLMAFQNSLSKAHNLM